jgi:hypothetical protein
LLRSNGPASPVSNGEDGREGRLDFGDVPEQNGTMSDLPPAAASALRALVDDYRDRCLWFLRRDYYPATTEEAGRVIEAIERHGDRAAYQRAAEIRPWLSLPSSATSAGS